MTSQQPGRPVAAVLGAVWGAALLIRPNQVLRAAGADPGLTGAVVAARVLGVRHLAQAAALAARPADVARPAIATDGLHAASMLGLALLAPRYRRAALASALVATALAVGTRGNGIIGRWRSAG
jgi:hypothetical protein